jgi:hypothetical protein
MVSVGFSGGSFLREASLKIMCVRGFGELQGGASR